MMFLPGLAVIFAGLLGGNGDIDAQLKSVLRKLHVKTVSMPKASLQKLTRHGESTRDVVRGLHADGVIACEVVKGEGEQTLRLVIYEGDGSLKAFSEIPLSGRKLGRGGLDALHSNLAGDVAALRGNDASQEANDVAVADDSTDAPPARAAKPPASAAKPAAPATKPAAPAARVAAAPQVAAADNDDAPQVAAPTQVASATTVAAADDDDAPEGLGIRRDRTEEPAAAAAAPTKRTLQVGAAAGVGVARRAFDPGPSMVAPYSSSPVPSVVVDVHLRPMKRLAFAVGAERSLMLTTEMSDGSAAATTISRYEAHGTVAALQLGGFELGARVGVGRRSFAIDSNDAMRSPDGNYNYLIAGVAASARLGQRIVLRAAAAFEPVLHGGASTDPMAGATSSSALEVGGSLEVRATTHVFVRAAGQYQRFTWSWDMVGGPAGGATDEYPSGALLVGADY